MGLRDTSKLLLRDSSSDDMLVILAVEDEAFLLGGAGGRRRLYCSPAVPFEILPPVAWGVRAALWVCDLGREVARSGASDCDTSFNEDWRTGSREV